MNKSCLESKTANTGATQPIWCSHNACVFFSNTESYAVSSKTLCSPQAIRPQVIAVVLDRTARKKRLFSNEYNAIIRKCQYNSPAGMCNKIVGKGGWQSNQTEKCVVQREKIERISTPAHAASRCQSYPTVCRPFDTLHFQLVYHTPFSRGGRLSPVDVYPCCQA